MNVWTCGHWAWYSEPLSSCPKGRTTPRDCTLRLVNLANFKDDDCHSCRNLRSMLGTFENHTPLRYIFSTPGENLPAPRKSTLLLEVPLTIGPGNPLVDKPKRKGCGHCQNGAHMSKVQALQLTRLRVAGTEQASTRGGMPKNASGSVESLIQLS